jgi:hypothetical protein
MQRTRWVSTSDKDKNLVWAGKNHKKQRSWVSKNHEIISFLWKDKDKNVVSAGKNHTINREKGELAQMTRDIFFLWNDNDKNLVWACTNYNKQMKRCVNTNHKRIFFYERTMTNLVWPDTNHNTQRKRCVRPCSLPHPNPKYFLFHPSHQIFRRMHGALNVGKKDN